MLAIKLLLVIVIFYIAANRCLKYMDDGHWFEKEKSKWKPGQTTKTNPITKDKENIPKS